MMLNEKMMKSKSANYKKMKKKKPCPHLNVLERFGLVKKWPHNISLCIEMHLRENMTLL